MGTSDVGEKREQEAPSGLFRVVGIGQGLGGETFLIGNYASLEEAREVADVHNVTELAIEFLYHVYDSKDNCIYPVTDVEGGDVDLDLPD
ncbi:MAG: hypothetical protein WAW90_01040 [Minisyncoccia bacterium]